MDNNEGRKSGRYPMEDNLNECESVNEKYVMDFDTVFNVIHYFVKMDGDGLRFMNERIRDEAPDMMKECANDINVFLNCISLYLTAAHNETDCSYIDYMFAKSIVSLFNYLVKQYYK